MNISSKIHSLLNRFILVNQGYWRLFILGSIALTVAGFAYAKKIHLDTDLARLLPQDSESVRNLKIIQSKSGGSHDLRIVLEGGPLETRLQAAQAFTELLHTKPELVRSVKYKTPKSFLEKYKYHLVPLKSLDAIHDEVLKEREKYADVLDPFGLQASTESGAPAAPKSKEDSKEQLDHAKQLLDQLDTMQLYYQTDDGNYLALRVVPALENLDIEKNRKVLKEFQKIVTEFNFARFHPDMKVAIHGTIPDHIARYDSIAADVRFGGIGIILILIVVAFYFKSIWALLVLTPPLVSGLAIGLGATYFIERTLNSITVFLVLVVFGMGIEFGIHLWARFLEERKKAGTVPALQETWLTTGRATLTSTFALFAGYGLLTLSSFQGFAQFGRVAMILISAVTLNFLLFMPSWVLLTERLRGDKVWPASSSTYFQTLIHSLKALPFSWGKCLRAISVVLGITGLVLSAMYLRFDYRFDDSNAQKSKPKSKEALSHIFKERLKPSAVAIFSDPNDAARFLTFYEDHQKEYPDIPLASGLSSFLPPDQNQRIAKLQEISDDIELSWLKKVEDPVVRKSLTEIKNSAESFKPIQFEDLPVEMKEPFLATDNSGDSLVYLYDKGGDTDGKKAMYFSDAVGRLEKESGQDPILSGQEIIFADVVRKVIHEGPYLVLGMLLLVFLICWLDFRSFKNAFSSMAPVLLGFLMTGLILVWNRELINFYNMIALASLGSMVVDNSIHLYHRYLENREAGVSDPGFDAAIFVSPTIVLCTITSVFGYGGMLFANHRGVSSLGFVATVGLVCCLISSTVFLPAWLSRPRN